MVQVVALLSLLLASIRLLPLCVRPLPFSLPQRQKCWSMRRPSHHASSHQPSTSKTRNCNIRNRTRDKTMMLRLYLFVLAGWKVSAFVPEPPNRVANSAFQFSNQPRRRQRTIESLADTPKSVPGRCHVSSPTALQSLSTSTISIDETAQREISSFEEWAVSCGVQVADGFQLMVASEDPYLDVGVMTSMDIAKDAPILYVPSEMMLSANRAKEELGQMVDAEDLFVQLNAYDQVQRFYLFCKILREYELGDESPWYPYLNSLPRYFSNGASMTDYCTECLPPLVGSLSLKEIARFKAFFKALEFCNSLSPDTRSNRDLAKWAYNVCFTRSFQDGHGDYKIAPMADMVRDENHK